MAPELRRRSDRRSRTHGGDNPTPMAATRQLSHVYPLGSRINERGRLEVGGCDAIELAREFGTPAYVVAEDDLRARARAFVERCARGHDADARSCSRPRPSPAPRSTGCSRRRGSACDVASAGELHLALHGGFDPGAHLPARQREGRRRAGARARARRRPRRHRRARRDRARWSALPPPRGARQRVLLRVTPGIKPNTHAAISTGQLDTKFGLTPRAGRAGDRAREGLGPARPRGPAHAHRLADLRARFLPARRSRPSPRWATLTSTTSAAASASPTRRPTRRRRSRPTSRPSRRGARAPGRGEAARDRAGPGADRQLDRDPLHGRVGQADVSTYVAVDGGHVGQPAADALRRRLRGADRRPLRRRDGVPRRRQALRVGRRHRARRRSSTTPAPATCSSRRRPAPTATRWRTTTTASRARR